MTAVPGDHPLLDAEAGPVVRPYSVTYGRTRPRSALDLTTMLLATGRTPRHMEPEHAQALRLCRAATSVAEVAANLQQPVVVAKVLLSDLIAWDALITGVPTVDAPDLHTMKDLLDGLRKLQFSSHTNGGDTNGGDPDRGEDSHRGGLRGG
jgi:Protein of unknown function (DUF742)